MIKSIKNTFNFLSEFSIPLLSGVILALFWANLDYHSYQEFIKKNLFPGFKFLGHKLTLHFLVNDIFMVFFFGIAAVEIKQAFSKGGSLSPISKAINPLFATIGGVAGPIVIFFILTQIVPLENILNLGISKKEILNGWGIPTATDIALAWLCAKFIFGVHHPAVSFLLLVAIVDDAIGLGIIAIFYPDPHHPVNPYFLILFGLALLITFVFNKLKIKNMWIYLLIPGVLSWLSLLLAYLHPALALVGIILLMPDNNKEIEHKHIFEDEIHDHSTAVQFEHTFKYFVDIGLFFFSLMNAGVLFGSINEITFIIFLSLLIGKLIGIFGLGFLANMLKFPLPKGMNLKDLLIIAIICGLGLTVALFVVGEAYTNIKLVGAAKMGALLSILSGPIAFILAKLLKIKKTTS